MKNVHVIPTDKPSRFFNTNTGEYHFREHYVPDTVQTCKNHNIYITSDEEIKEGDWFISLNDDESFMDVIKNTEENFSDFADEEWTYDCKKIILTTDQDLIKDGVQPIDDEFLEWFVKNPTCEEVEVILNEVSYVVEDNIYKIIIPKEEPTEEAKQRAKNYMSLKGALEPKQEHTLEEAVKRLFPFTKDDSENRIITIKRLFWIAGAKWQLENMPIHIYAENTYVHIEDGTIIVEKNDHTIMSYSEDDLREAFKQSRQCKIFEKDMPPVYEEFEDWFEQFKKK